MDDVTTPSARREAWLELAKGLERELGAVLVNARAMAKAGPHELRAEYHATAWAARRLLDAVQALPAPLVPVDPVPGQGTLDELGGSDG